MIDWRVTYQSDSVRAKPSITVHIHLELFKCSPGTTSLYHTKFMDSSISNPEKRDGSQIGAIGVLKASFMFLFNYMIIHYFGVIGQPIIERNVTVRESRTILYEKIKTWRDQDPQQLPRVTFP